MLIINFILGLLPIIWLVIALCGLKWPGYKAALGALIIAAVEALTYFGFSMSDTLTSILEGFDCNVANRYCNYCSSLYV